MSVIKKSKTLKYESTWIPPVGRIALFSLLHETEGCGAPTAWQISSANEFSCTTTDLQFQIKSLNMREKFQASKRECQINKNQE